MVIAYGERSTLLAPAPATLDQGDSRAEVPAELLEYLRPSLPSFALAALFSLGDPLDDSLGDSLRDPLDDSLGGGGALRFVACTAPGREPSVEGDRGLRARIMESAARLWDLSAQDADVGAGAASERLVLTLDSGGSMEVEASIMILHPQGADAPAWVLWSAYNFSQVMAQQRERVEVVERRLRALARSSNDLLTLTNARGIILSQSETAWDILGRDVHERVGRDLLSAIHDDDRIRALDAVRSVIATPGASAAAECRFRHADGSWRWLASHVTNLLEDADVGALVIHSRDVTSRRRAELLNARSSAVMEMLARGVSRSVVLSQVASVVGEVLADTVAGVWMVGAHGRIHGHDDGHEDDVLAPQRVEAADGQCPCAAVAARRAPIFIADVTAPAPQGRRVIDVQRCADHGGVAPEGMRACWCLPVMEYDGVAVQAVITVLRRAPGAPAPEDFQLLSQLNRLVEVTLARDRLIAERIHAGRYDGLTGLGNRTVLLEETVAALERVHEGDYVALAILELDGLRTLNDTEGHLAGDAALLTASQHFQEVLDSGEVATRISGDQLATCWIGRGDPTKAARRVEVLRRAVELPQKMGVHQVVVQARGGVATARDKSAAGDLLRNASLALQRARTAPSRVVLFDEQMHTQAVRRVEMEEELRQAIDGVGLVVHYQPQIDVVSGSIVGVEALVRWAHPSRGWLSPAEFLPLAEETGLIVALGAWVLRAACREIAVAAPHLRVSVNLSARQLGADDLIAVVTQALADSGLPAGQLCLEITESVVMEDAAAAQVLLTRLRGLGVRLAVDDFGTGYSSLAYLRRFPIDELKVDRAFVSNVASDAEDRTIVGAIVQLAAGLGLEVVAEGVETLEQLAVLRELKCTLGQGYLWSRPIGLFELGGLLAPSSVA